MVRPAIKRLTATTRTLHNAVVFCATALVLPGIASAQNTPQTAPTTNVTPETSSNETLAPDMSPVGIWQTIDDKTHEPRALIQIKRAPDGSLSGTILIGLDPDNNPAKRCTECTDERKGQLVQGLTIIRNLKRQGDAWEGGDILDPENGKIYHCRIQVIDKGQKLALRGYIGVPLLGRTQTWIRERHPDATIARARERARSQTSHGTSTD